ncbi:MAG: type-F conjugative transfer system protein TraW, partial [Alphaproteobacteria bacterium]
RGIIAQILTGMEKAARKTVMHPKPVEGIRNATENNTRMFDPTYTLSQDVMDQEGRLIHKAGTTMNPLDNVTLDRPLIFISGTNREQVRWAVNKSKELNGKIILTSGSAIELMRDYQHQFYFDQQGMISSRLKIQVVPSIVTQEGDMLSVEEIALNKNN